MKTKSKDAGKLAIMATRRKGANRRILAD
jgi:hypothetical protein